MELFEHLKVDKSQILRIAVIGSGSWGIWTALELLERGIEVHLYDHLGAGNSFSGSGGLTRIIRRVYGADEIYVNLTDHSYEKWEELYHDTNDFHFEETGVLWLQGDPNSDYLKKSFKLLENTDHPIEQIELKDAVERWSP